MQSDQCLYCSLPRYSIILLVPIAEISRPYLVAVAEQAGLNLNWSKTLKTGFLVTWLTYIWAAPSEFVTYRLCEQRRFRRACASAQSRQNLRCSLIQAVNQEEPSDRKPDPWPLWMAGHARLKFVMTECSKTQIRLAGLIYIYIYIYLFLHSQLWFQYIWIL